LLLLLPGALLAGCASEAPLREALPPLEGFAPPTAEAERTASASEPVEAPAPVPIRPVYLYERTDEDLRLAYADGLASLLNAPATPEQARRLSPDEARSWLAFLQEVNAEAASFARNALGPTLREDALVAYALPGSNPASCARLRETLFVAVPERHQSDARPFVGLIVRDACGDGAPCLRCTNVGGAAVGGRRPRVCAVSPCGR